jgi:GAF domain-containing protein
VSDITPMFKEAVASLTQYFVGDATLKNNLQRVCELTIKAVPVVDHVGITLLVHDKLKTSVFTHPEVPDIDQAQYRTGEGPCVEAFRTGETYTIDSTREPGRWQEFRDSAERHGVLSTLSLPLLTNDGPIGAMNLYSEVEDAHDDDSRRVAMLFATQAAFVLANAQAYWDARTLSENLEQAMKSRATIEQAKGAIMATMGCDEDTAMQVLIDQSQRQNIKLREIADEIVRNATRSSRPFH